MLRGLELLRDQPDACYGQLATWHGMHGDEISLRSTLGEIVGHVVKQALQLYIQDNQGKVCLPPGVSGH